jgi:hypothetical protein
MKYSIWTRYGFAWVTGGFFVVSLIGHWVFGWFAYANEQSAHAQAVTFSGYAIEMMRDTLENWQSEFLQLLWQVAGLAILLHVGSPQSREGDDRMEAKLDAILRKVDPDEADKLISEIDKDYMGRHTDHRYVRERQH